MTDFFRKNLQSRQGDWLEEVAIFIKEDDGNFPAIPNRLSSDGSCFLLASVRARFCKFVNQLRLPS